LTPFRITTGHLGAKQRHSPGEAIHGWAISTISPVEDPKVSGLYISSALAGAAMKVPGVVPL
jgi:hypothetical protein